jgi:hypothetical protein
MKVGTVVVALVFSVVIPVLNLHTVAAPPVCSSFPLFSLWRPLGLLRGGCFRFWLFAFLQELAKGCGELFPEFFLVDGACVPDREDLFVSDPVFVVNATDDKVQRLVCPVSPLDAFGPGFDDFCDQADNLLREAQTCSGQEDIRENLWTRFVLLECEFRVGHGELAEFLVDHFVRVRGVLAMEAS